LFYAFLKSFLEHPTQVLLLEVGLGGRLDAVNLLAADIGIITSIGRDHQAFLGKTYRAILQEKLGITRPGQILLSALELKYLQQQIQAWAAQNHLAWQDLFGQGVLKKTDPYPQRNAALALRAEQAIKDLSKARKILAAPGRAAAAPPLTLGPGRREFWPKACPGPHNQWLFIGGHNPDGLRKMAAYLHQEKIKIDQVLASFTQRPYQDLQANLQMLLQLDGHPPITLAAFDHPKAVPLADLQNLARDVCLAVPIKVKCWHQRLQEEFGHEAGTTLVTGSFYFVGLVQHAFLAAGPSRDGGVCHRR
jgi:folylpolyglutamate synthase/dihydropteroate synthase